VIFTTSYDEYALKAFKVNSVDYLLKPVQKDELESAWPSLKTSGRHSLIRKKKIRRSIAWLKNCSKRYR
jgi:two-component SAPR family response regulator